MAELKKCPFCGGEAKYMNITEGIFISKFVTCTKCGIETKRNYLRRNEAIKAWNNRPTESEIRAKAFSEMRDKLIIHFAECQTETEYADIKQILTNVCEDIDEIAEELKGGAD